MCGQSGSGKTYSLGLVLEQLLVETSLRMVILDPNSDYVRLGEVRDGADPTRRPRYAAAAGRRHGLGQRAGADQPLRLRFAELDTAAQAAVLGLDPVARPRGVRRAGRDPGRGAEEGRRLITGLDALLGSDEPDVRQLGLRARNLGVLDWSIWSRARAVRCVEELEEPTVRCLGGRPGLAATPRGAAADRRDACSSTLWRNREPPRARAGRHRRGAQRLPAQAGRPGEPALRPNTPSLIAAEGRKFGLYLLDLDPAPAEGATRRSCPSATTCS